jgi:hypothetical protein
MKIPIRIIGILTTFLWIFLIVFFASAVYSAKYLKFSFGEPQKSVASSDKILFALPITVTNEGYYNVGAFNLTTKVFDKSSFVVAQNSTFIPIIHRGLNITTSHNMSIDVKGLVQNDQDYLFNDTELEINQIVDMKLAEAIPVQASTNLSMPWGAPLYNFAIGEPRHEPHNETHAKATVSIMFENHALFDLTGFIHLYMYDGDNELVSEGLKLVEAPQNSLYESSIELYFSITETLGNGRIVICFQTSFFDYGPAVIPYG